MTLDAAIIDVGASNVEDFLKLMQQYDGLNEESDVFIIPVVKEKKVQSDTNTIRPAAVGHPQEEDPHGVQQAGYR